MKKFTNLFFVLTLALLMLSGCNEKKSEPASPDTPAPAPAEYVSVSDVSLSKISIVFTKIGETLQLEATVTPDNATNPKVTWKSSNTAVATVSDNGLVTCKGFGDATITVTAEDKSATCAVSAIKDSPVDACGNVYKFTKVGNQIWMSENMRCNKYDTQSERAGAEISTSSSAMDNPYYIDASDKNNWESEKYVTEELLQYVAKFGYLYNWAAAVGIENGESAWNMTEPFSDNRQGICPNGWHVPSDAEWDVLAVALGGTSVSHGDFTEVGKKLKTTSGWYNGGNGTDECSFAALPTSSAPDGKVQSVGQYANFWTATPKGVAFKGYAYGRCLAFYEDYMMDGGGYKHEALSVRCVKNY